MKLALRDNYQKRIFLGGRGPECFYCLNDWTYKNLAGGDWKNFFGREDIHKILATPQAGWVNHGHHRYRGQLLIGPDRSN